MYITLTICFDKNKFDVRIDSRQEIMAVYKTLYESGKVKLLKVPCWYRSDAKECMVSAYRTFEEEGIYSGDILTAITEDENGENN